MKRTLGWMALAVMAASLSVPGRAQSPSASSQAKQQSPDKRTAAEDVIKAWPVSTKADAMSLMDKYGVPDGVTDERLSWNNKDPWSRVTLMREGVTDNFPTTHQNVVENTIRYVVPREKAGEILKFNSALVVDRRAGTLSARSDSEQANILALNLADEIIRNKREVDEARTFMRDTLRETMAGKSSPYTDHLLFHVSRPVAR